MFNALDIMHNKEVLEELKFGVGDGNLHYYLYNWKCPEIPSNQVRTEPGVRNNNDLSSRKFLELIVLVTALHSSFL